jgi:hypothetical protein
VEAIAAGVKCNPVVPEVREDGVGGRRPLPRNPRSGPPERTGEGGRPSRRPLYHNHPRRRGWSFWIPAAIARRTSSAPLPTERVEREENGEKFLNSVCRPSSGTRGFRNTGLKWARVGRAHSFPAVVKVQYAPWFLSLKLSMLWSNGQDRIRD